MLTLASNIRNSNLTHRCGCGDKSFYGRVQEQQSRSIIHLGSIGRVFFLFSFKQKFGTGELVTSCCAKNCRWCGLWAWPLTTTCSITVIFYLISNRKNTNPNFLSCFFIDFVFKVLICTEFA